MNKRSTFKTIYFIIISVFILINPLFVNAENLTYTEAQNMVKEVMKQYYVRGPYFQYNYAKAEYYNLAPEEGTLQDNKYTVCAGYTHNVYNQAFGILGSTKYMSAKDTFKENAFPRYNYHIIYAGQHAYKKIKSGDLTDDGNLLLYYESTTSEKDPSGEYERKRSVVRFVTGDTNTSSNSGDLARIIKKVKPGDLFVYTGHALIAYDTIDKDGDGTKDDVLILEATGGGNEIRSRIPGTSRLYYTAHKSEYTDALKYLNLEEEGIFRIVLLSSIKKFVPSGELDCNEEECAIIRPFYKGSNSEAVFNFQQTISKTDTAVKKSAIRVKYPSLHIEKTVSKGDNNSIYIGDELTYTIKVTNRSDITPTTTTYPAFTINETLDSNVTCTDCTGWTVSGTSITQTVSQKLAPGESITLTYKVKVKDDVSVVGEIITSTGSFYDTSTNKGILGTGTVKNKVIPKVVNYIRTYANCYDNKGSQKGLALIDYIYSCALGKNFNFSEFKFSSLIKTSEPSKSGSKIEYVAPLDENHTQFKKMILNNYISGLAPTADTDPIYYFPRFTSTNITRAKTINAIDFKDGDVLIYDIAANDYTHENGTYAYIYKGGTFVGVNGSDMTVRNAFNTTYHSYAYWNNQGISNYLNVTNSLYKYDDDSIWSGFTTAEKKHILYQSLYGKDNYVILRPELAIKEVVELEITANPTKTSYIQNYGELNLTGGTIKVTYNDGTTATKNMSDPDVTVEGFSNTTTGTKKLTVTHGGKSDTFTVSVVAKSATKIEVTTKPTKTSYIQNYEDLNLTGGKIKVTYNDESTETINMTDSNVSVTGFDNTTTGTKTLTVSYKNKTTTFTVSVVAKSITKIEVSTKPTKTSYIQNYETLNLTGGKIKATYNDTSTEIIDMTNTNVSVTGFSNSTVGEKTLTVTYKSKTTTFTVSVVAKSATKIEVSTKPTKTTYITNYETLNLDGGTIKVTYNDTSTETISMTDSNVSVTGFTNNTLGNVTLTVTYKGKTTTFYVTIVDKTAIKLEVITNPTKTSYIQNYENLNLTGGTIKVTYNDNSTATKNMIDPGIEVTGFNNTKVGKNTLTITYKNVSTTFDVTIVAKSITKIAVSTLPTKTTYIQNYETLNLAGGKIKATYDDTSTEIIDMTNTNVSVTGFSNKTLGEATLTVTYKSKTTTFKVSIVTKLATKIEVTSKPTKTSYIQNYENLNLDGGKIKVTYNDNSTETINMTDSNVSVTGFSNTTLGEVTLTVTYKTKTTTFKITIVDKVTLKETFINKGYKAKDSYIHGFEIGELLTDLKNTIKLDYQTNGKTKVATGIEFKYNTETLTAVLYGDLNGDGVINSADLLRMRQHLLNLNPLTGAYKEAGLIENKTTINSADLLRIRQHLLNIRLIQQQ